MKEYILIIKNKKDNNVFIECKDMEDVENKLFEYSKDFIEFEIYKAINTDDVIKLSELVFKRLFNNLK